LPRLDGDSTSRNFGKETPDAASLAKFPELPRDVVEAAVTEFKDLVASAYFDDLAVKILVMLLRRLEDTAAEARRRFARSADQLGYTIVVPGVERANPRPWR